LLPEAEQFHEETKHILTSYAWYTPDLDREGVTALLRGKEQGTFCVCKSVSAESELCGYVLYVHVSPTEDLWCTMIIQTQPPVLPHGILRQMSVAGPRTSHWTPCYHLFAEQEFDSIPDLIEHYRSNSCVPDNSRPVKLVGSETLWGGALVKSGKYKGQRTPCWQTTRMELAPLRMALMVL